MLCNIYVQLGRMSTFKIDEIIDRSMMLSPMVMRSVSRFFRDMVPNLESRNLPALGGKHLLICLNNSKRRNGEMCLDWHDVSDLLDNIGQKPTDGAIRKQQTTITMDSLERKSFLYTVICFFAGCGVVHLSSGDVLREEVQANTPLGWVGKLMRL